MGPGTLQIKQKVGRTSLFGLFDNVLDIGPFLADLRRESLLVLGSA